MSGAPVAITLTMSAWPSQSQARRSRRSEEPKRGKRQTDFADRTGNKKI